MKQTILLGAILLMAAGGLGWMGLVGAWPVRKVEPRPSPKAGNHPAPVAAQPAPAPALPPPPPPVVLPLPEMIGPVQNIVASERGGEVESITGECGPGFTGNLLIDRRTDKAWSAASPVAFPQEIVFSFFNREPAAISSMVLMGGQHSDAAPKDIEIWTSVTTPDAGFTLAAASSLPNISEDKTLSFLPVRARFVKLRIVSGYSDRALEIGKIQILEADLPNYQTLAARNPEIVSWNHSARYAAQKGIEWLQPAAVAWQKSQNCFGCHVQSQVIMGLALSEQGKYVVSHACKAALADFTRKAQNADGTFHNSVYLTATSFAAMGMSYEDGTTVKRDPNLLKATAWLLKHQGPSGIVENDHGESPIDQGSIVTTANSLTAFSAACRQSGDARYVRAADRGLQWILDAPKETTQDKIFAIIAVSKFGTRQQRQRIPEIVDQLKKEQKQDGGWAESSSIAGSNAYATGQVLYAFKQAEMSVEAPEFVRGVGFLLSNQKETGSWPQQNSASGRPSEFAPTMWAVIGLAVRSVRANRLR